VRSDADVNFFFLAPNDISFVGPSDDPFFPTHSSPYTITPGTTLYRPDVWSSVLGCTDQYEICNPVAQKDRAVCTPLVGLPSLHDESLKLNLSAAQASTVGVLLWALKETGLSSSIAGRGAAALKAQGTVYSNRQGQLPNNQWTIEAAGWFDTALAKLQFAIVEFAQGPSAADQALMSLPLPANSATCNVKVRSSAYTNFSVLGIGIIFGVGGFLLVLSWVVDILVGKVQELTGRGKERKVQWMLDSKIQLLRQLYDEILPPGMSIRKEYDWAKVEGAVPILPGRPAMADVAQAADGLERQGKSWPRYAFVGEDGEEMDTMLPTFDPALDSSENVARV
jgi:hypothetical protein